MAKADNPHALRLYESLKAHANEAAADRLLGALPLSKSADADKKIAWAESVCAALDREFDNKTVKKIRMDCACGPDEARLSKIRKLYASAPDMAAFAAQVNAAAPGFTLQTNGTHLLMLYPRCYCPMVKRSGTPLPQSWCYCTLGYAKRMFEYVLGRDVEVELEESVISGGKECRIRVTPL